MYLLWIFFITSACPVLDQVPVPDLVPVPVPDQNWSQSLVPVPVLGPGPVIFLVPALVPVPSYFWSRPWSRSKFLVPSHSGGGPPASPAVPHGLAPARPVAAHFCGSYSQFTKSHFGLSITIGLVLWYGLGLIRLL